MNDEQPIDGADSAADESGFRAALEPFGTTLGGAPVWAVPPVSLEDRIVSQVRAASIVAPPATDNGRTGRTRTVLRRVLPAVAAVAVAFVAGVLLAGRGDDNDDVAAIADLAMTGTALAPEAAAQGDVVDRDAGYAIRLQMAGLAPAPDGSYYEGWLRADDGAMVSVGTFHMRGGDGAVVLWSGVPIAEYDTLVVTEQVERSADDSSGRVVLEGTVVRR